MKTTFSCLLLTIFFFVTLANNSFAQHTSDTIYQCAPCGCHSDDKTFDKPGNCQSCGMKLEALTKAFNPLKNLDKPMNVAILLYNHAQVLDYAGPYDVFIAGGKNFNVYTVAETSDEVITMPNLSVNPQYNISNSPKPDILIIPGGMWNSLSPKMHDWIKEKSKDADHVLSVCTGAFILAEIGLLDSLDATTHKAGIDMLERNYPAINKVHNDKRFIDNGKYITSAGVSAGIDASLYLISKTLGKDWAEAVATNLEYTYYPSKN